MQYKKDNDTFNDDDTRALVIDVILLVVIAGVGYALIQYVF
jgi:hypothetical protein